MTKISSNALLFGANAMAEKLIESVRVKSEYKEGKPKLIFYFKQLSLVESSLIHPVPMYSYNLKYRIIEAYESGNLDNYLSSDEYKADIDQYQVWRKIFINDFVGTKKGRSMKKFLEANNGLIPEEIIHILKEKGYTDFESIPENKIIESILGHKIYADKLEVEISNIVDEIAITAEDLDDFARQFNGKIKWLGTADEFGEFATSLHINGWTKYPNETETGLSHPKEAAILLCHFDMSSRKKKITTSIKVPGFKNIIAKLRAPLAPVITNPTFKFKSNPDKK